MSREVSVKPEVYYFIVIFISLTISQQSKFIDLLCKKDINELIYLFFGNPTDVYQNPIHVKDTEKCFNDCLLITRVLIDNCDEELIRILNSIN